MQTIATISATFSQSAARIGPDCGSPVRIGLALGGGFARGIAHAGVLRVREQHQIPIHCITGISAGAIVAAAYASGATPEEIVRGGCSMRFGDVGRFSLGRLGLVSSQRMNGFLERLLKTYRCEHMRIPLGVIATDLSTGEPVSFTRRAACSIPFAPVAHIQDCFSRLTIVGASWWMAR